MSHSADSPTPTANEGLWFYSNSNDQPVGPVPFAELLRLAAAGAIRPETQVIEHGASQWRTLREVTLAGETKPVAPPTSPPAEPEPNSPIRWGRTLGLFLLWPVGLYMLSQKEGFRPRERMLFLVLFWPAGLYALWRASATFPKSRKLAARAFVAGFASLIVLAFISARPERTKPIDPVSVAPEAPKKPKVFRRGAMVVVAKGTMVFGDAGLLAEIAQAHRNKDEAGVKAASEKLVGKTGTAGDDSVFTVVQPVEDGAFYELEGTTKEGQRQVWYATYDSMSPYVSPEEAKARAELAAAEAQLAADRVAIEKIAKNRFHDKLLKVQVTRILSGPSEGLYNVEIRFDGNGGWSAKTQKRWIETQMKDTYKDLFTSRISRIWEVWFFAEATLIDQFGQESTDVVYKTSMTSAIGTKINWENMHLLDFSNLWQTHRFAPALNKD